MYFCNKVVSYSTEEGTKTLKRHMKTNIHISSKNRLKAKKLEDVTHPTAINKTFDEKLAEAFTLPITTI